MPLEFKPKSKRYLRLLLVFTKNSWQRETAYFSNNIFAMLSPIAYTLAYLSLITVLFQNVNSIAGYSKDEMFFIFLLGQILFYLYRFWADGGVLLEKYVNDGTMDYILTKPVSSLFYITFHVILPLNLMVSLLGPLTPFWFIINWSALSFEISAVPAAIAIIIIGVVLYGYAQFILTCTSFWTGKGKQASLLVYAVNSQSIPLEGMNSAVRGLALVAIPVMYSSVAASVMLGKSSALVWLAISFVVFLIFFVLKRLIWGKALKQYSSASS